MDPIGHRQARPTLRAKKHVLWNAAIDMTAPITLGLMTKDVGPQPAAAKPFLLVGMFNLLFVKKVF